MNILSQNTAFGGMQGVFSHTSEACKTDMTFAVYVPPAAIKEKRPVLWYLSGLTCTHANVMEKGEYRRVASELGLIVVCPDVSPRGNDVPDELTNWKMGKGAGMYLDATEMPWAEHYRMYSYITEELPALVAQHFKVDMDRQGIFGHSMGGHGAMTIALKNPDRFKSCSAFAPIVEPSTAEWTSQAFEKYPGGNTMPARWSRTAPASRNSSSTRARRTRSSTRACALGCSKRRSRAAISV
jgi:S-formylglutathione hydrolase